MENRTDMTGVAAMDKLRQVVKSNRTILELAGAAVSGFVMANSFILGGIAPFGVSFAAALTGRYAHCAALGALLGYVFSSHLLTNIKYIAALLFVVIIKWVAENRLEKSNTPALCVGSAFGAMLVSSAVILLTMDFTLYDVLVSVAEVFLASGSAYFFARTLSAGEAGLASATKSDISCAIVSGAVVLMGLSGFRIGGLSVGRILAVLVILVCARYGGESAGAIAGITAGIAIGLAGKDFSYVVSAYAFGGLIAGVFHHAGRLISASAFVVVNALAALFVSRTVDVYTAVFEIFVASAIFMAVPKSVLKRFRLTGTAAGADGSTQAMLNGKLGGISRVLQDISSTTHAVSERLGKLENRSVDRLHTAVADKVCRHCGNRTTCWQFHYNDTMEAMSEGVRLLKKDGSLNRENAPKYFVRSCCKMDMLLGELNTAFRDSVSREGVQRKVSQVRSVVTDQFDGMAMMLNSISKELCAVTVLDPAKYQRVREYLQKQNFQQELLLCYSDEFERMRVEVTLPTYQLARLDKTQMALELSDLLETDFDLPRVTVLDKSAELCFHEKAALTIEVGTYQIACGGAKICGDAYDYIREQNGKAHLILSDGMGSGGGAAVDASMASGLITRLLSVGIGHEAALKMVNSALLIKSGEESLATIDVCSVDLFTGKVDFYKAGAAPSYILRSGRSGCVQSTSLPAGILRGVSFEHSSVTLRAGDIVLLVSDGVIATGVEWVLSELEHLSAGQDIQRICEKLAMTAKMRREDGREDDITVVAAMLKKGI
ncbi:SpoIIE family protein phosphatase [Ruminococcaceae bacterium OttesenSCG-928-L11]|nr:SpoIIE family protein phosphatase [Ruminococcaceae bacterium OttesenSCG-928-L11]